MKSSFQELMALVARDLQAKDAEALVELLVERAQREVNAASTGEALEHDVARGAISPTTAATRLADELLQSRGDRR